MGLGRRVEPCFVREGLQRLNAHWPTTRLGITRSHLKWLPWGILARGESTEVLKP